ncbi:MAG: hypothetical protein H5U30_03115, partial [Marinobacter sp.]|nr:hypothetical protein [Marinobacter sp.]
MRGSNHRSRAQRGFLSGLIGSLFLVAGCATHHNAPAPAIAATPKEESFRVAKKESYQVERDLQFSPIDWPEALFADLYVPESQTTERAHPVVLMVHGGGWQRRSREDMAWIAEEIASHGF